MQAWTWLKSWNKTPADLGLDWSEVDPWYQPAMLVIEAGYSRAMQSDIGSD